MAISSSNNILLAPFFDGIATTQNFEGEIRTSRRRPKRKSRKATIGDRVFLDENQNGLQDAHESGVSNVTVKLLSDGHVIATTTTDNHGDYQFSALVPGIYQVQFVAPENFFFTDANIGNDDTIDSDADPHTGTTGLISLNSGETDNSVDAGIVAVDESEPELSVVWLGFDFDSDVGLEVIDERVFDLDEDGDFLNDDGTDELVPFLTPKVGGTFTQTFSITNTGGAGENITVVLQESSSIFVELIDVTGEGVSFDPLTNTVTIANIGQGETINLNATSQIINGDGTLTEAVLTFDLIDDPNNPNDFGNASANATQYWSATGFETEIGETTFQFNEFAPSILQLDLDGDSQPDATSDELNLLRFDGTLIEGTGGLEPGVTHQIFGLETDGDTDPRSRARTRARSIIFEGELELAWDAAPGVDLTTFTSLSADGTLPDSNDAFNEFLRLTNEDGIFSEIFAVPTTVSGGNVYVSELRGQRFNPDGTPIGDPFVQEAISGSIVNVPLFSETVVTNTNAGGEGSLRQAILNANAIDGPNIITFAGSTFTDGIPDVITLTSGLTINDDVIIDGANFDITITGGSFELITIGGATASINGLTFDGGSTALQLNAQQPELTLTDVDILNSTDSGIAVKNAFGAEVNLNDVTIRNVGEAGIDVSNGGNSQLTAVNTTITGSGGDGVSVKNIGGAVISFTDSTIDGNGDDNLNLAHFSNVQVTLNNTTANNAEDKGIEVSNGSNFQLIATNADITGSGGDGVGIKDISGVTVGFTDSDVSGNGDDTIDLENFSNVQITFDDVTASTVGEEGIEVSNGSGLTLTLGNGTVIGGADNEGATIGRSNTTPTTIIITGTDGTNVLNGSNIDDLITGGLGNDIMTGNDGNDTFVFGPNSGRDIINDFVPGVDLLDVSALGITTLEEMTFTGNTVIFNGNNGEQVSLNGVNATILTAADFVFA